MVRILYGISPIGLGHATRAVALADELGKGGAEVRFFSGETVAKFMAEAGLATDSIVSDPVPEVVDGEMKNATLWYLRSWLALRKTRQRTRELFQQFRPDLVLCDEEFSGIQIAQENGLRNIFISDELELGFARSRIAGYVERRVERWYRKLQDSVGLLIVPDFGTDTGNLHYVGPIVRKPTRSRTEVETSFGLPQGGKMVFVSMSGSGIGDYLVRKTISSVSSLGRSELYVVVAGNRGPKFKGPGIFDLGVVANGQDLVAAADLVISTAGKSLIDESKSTGTPFVVIPIRNHAEQERNARAEGYSFGDLQRLAELISAKIGRRETPQDAPGAARVSQIILSMF